MSELIPSELKVTDLRKELVARNLPTNGLKKDLVQRLEESLGISGERASGSQLDADDQIDLLPADEQDEVDEETAEHVLEGPIDAMETEEAEENGVKRNNDWDADAIVAHADLNAGAGADADADDQMDTSEQQHLQAGSGVLDSMYIKNLERPLTVYRIKELLGKYGSVDDVWLNAIKTRGYARFTSAEEAQAAFASINGTRFPPEHGKILECGLVTKERMQELIGDEEAMSETVLNNDLVVIPVDGGNCGVALVNVNSNAKGRGKGAAKKQKTDAAPELRAEREPKVAKVAERTANIVAAAATAAANEACDAAKDSAMDIDGDRRRDSLKEREPQKEGRRNDRKPVKVDDDEFTQKTVCQPPISYRPLTDDEVAAKKAAAAAAPPHAGAHDGSA
ncbi:hypothetical protein LPJ66_008631 [Kickxella alabastrina]|uniref:Uncharacterized protein n=1 Tax=Kickxella alabastrina TaxID=61397 RepID=A0ACC1I5I5_9FUNG|nr:hypothetical protein LPJ66_008631 [Kickxella alabastrina]